MNPASLYDLSPAASIMLVGGLLALVALGWVWLRRAPAEPGARLRALTLMTLFLTFDLVLFGAYTRLSDSGLGCPDWPGCYGSASPVGAHASISAAQAALPSGPVTHGKAWIEMLHRYLATGVGVLITVLAIAAWVQVRRGFLALSPWWPTLTWLWVCLQGAFGALTVTMKLYPAIVTAHLLGGLGLLALLAAQSQTTQRRTVPLPSRLHAALWLLAALTVVQVMLGGWVSTNYAVLACSDFPTCQGSWWPSMDVEQGFTVFRELGAGKDGGYLPFAALTAIHYVHRIGAAVLLSTLALVAWRLNASGSPALQRWAVGLAAIGAWQFASGLGNVVLGWPLAAALAHTGGAGALVALLAMMLTRSAPLKSARGTQGRTAHRLGPAS